MIPAVIATNGLGMPVRPVDKNAPPMVISPNGLGMPVVISDLGIPHIISGLEPAPGVFRITAGTAGGFTGYSDGSIVGAAGSIDGDFSGFPVVHLYSSTGSNVLVAITGDHTAAMTSSRIVIDGVSLTGGAATYDAGGDYTFATYPGFSFVDGETYTCELILEE